jgi:cell division transport system permease protein
MRANFILDSVITGIRRNLTMTIALILSTAIALAFVGASILASSEISHFKEDYEGKLNVSVFLCTTTNAGQGGCVARPILGANGKQKVIDGVKQSDATTTKAQRDAIAKKLSNDPAVTSFSFVSQRTQYERVKKTLSSSELAGLREGDLGASYTVKLKDIKNDYTPFVQRYQRLPGVYGTTNSDDVLKTLLSAIDGARLFSILIAIVVLVASILLIANTIQVAAAQRRNETSIMRLVGASRWMTELPFILEAVFAAIVGGLISFGMVWFGKYFVLNNIFAQQTKNGVIPNLSTNELVLASGAGLLAGIVISALTAFLTLRLYVKL